MMSACRPTWLCSRAGDVASGGDHRQLGLANHGKYVSQARPWPDACIVDCSNVLDAVMPGAQMHFSPAQQRTGQPSLLAVPACTTLIL